MDEAVRAYIAGIDLAHRALFDRIHQLTLAAHPDATVVISYGIPTYKLGSRRLFVGVWKHGVSIYGWQSGRDSGFAARHSALKSGKATIRLTPDDAKVIGDDELSGLLRAALDA